MARRILSLLAASYLKNPKIAEGGEEAQLKRIDELQAENDAIGQELQKQLEAAVD